MIHPSDKKYSEALEIRQQQAQKRDRFVNPLFFQARMSRITRCSSFSIPLPSNSYLHPAEQYFNDAVGPKRPKSLPIICFPDDIS
ncbi:hypothetical protein [Bathymodiolus japonicus methanotrophic gill symbiont]|uniref:hypothetical protein n=1 Tax=Bathymodiolus japonicus methanotrophic gill symbiont TaxID=113269 RepID=UPI001C8E9AAF|nr:hypothetical protein [Bathymodiolus japonicus methanotrophic gill symbiont]